MKRITLVFSLFLLNLTMIGYAHNWMAPKKEAEKKNPIKISEESVASGNSLFIDYCSACHGENALGFEAEKDTAEITPPNLVKRLKSHSDGDFFWKIQNGRGEMPGFKEDLEEKEIWSILVFIRSLIN